MKYDRWKSQIEIMENLMEVLYGINPEDLDQATDVDQRIKEVLTVVSPKTVVPPKAG